MSGRLVVALAFFVLLFPLAGRTTPTQDPSVADLSPKVQSCVEKMRAAVDQYFGTYKGQPPRNIDIIAFNDLSCAYPEWRANVVVLIGSPRDASSYFGIFHVRFLFDGTLRSMTPINATNATWTQMRSKLDWREDWCDLLRTAYPSDHQRACVPGRDGSEKQ